MLHDWINIACNIIYIIRPTITMSCRNHHGKRGTQDETKLVVKTQELNYRKQIARQLRTQFVEGISVTLKSTLRVTQGHWKPTIGQIIHDLRLDELLDV